MGYMNNGNEDRSRGEEAKAEILHEAKMVFEESFIPEVLREIAVDGIHV